MEKCIYMESQNPFQKLQRYPDECLHHWHVPTYKLLFIKIKKAWKNLVCAPRRCRQEEFCWHLCWQRGNFRSSCLTGSPAVLGLPLPVEDGNSWCPHPKLSLAPSFAHPFLQLPRQRMNRQQESSCLISWWIFWGLEAETQAPWNGFNFFSAHP